MSDVTRIIAPGSPLDRLRFGDLCEVLGKRIVEAEPNHTAYRIDLYREIVVEGRSYFVRAKFCIPFLSVSPEGNG